MLLYLMHDEKRFLTAENKSTEFETVGADPEFRGEAGGDARGKDTCMDMQGHRGLGRSPSRFATLALLKSQK